jgi:hypothetical protein
VADGGKKSGAQVVKDPTDRGGKLYDPNVYAACDIEKVKATVKGGRLIATVSTRGKQQFPNSYLNLNTKGSKRSGPEYQAQPSGGLVMIKGNKFDADGANTKQKNKGKALRFEITLKKIGRPKKTGFQAQSCGEGAVDIAPGKNYFDDKSFDGTVAHKYKSIKTR